MQHRANGVAAAEEMNINLNSVVESPISIAEAGRATVANIQNARTMTGEAVTRTVTDRFKI